MRDYEKMMLVGALAIAMGKHRPAPAAATDFPGQASVPRPTFTSRRKEEAQRRRDRKKGR